MCPQDEKFQFVAIDCRRKNVCFPGNKNDLLVWIPLKRRQQDRGYCHVTSQIEGEGGELVCSVPTAPAIINPMDVRQMRQASKPNAYAQLKCHTKSFCVLEFVGHFRYTKI